MRGLRMARLSLRLSQPRAPRSNLLPPSLSPLKGSRKSPNIIPQNHILNTVLIKHQNGRRQDAALLFSAEPAGAHRQLARGLCGLSVRRCRRATFSAWESPHSPDG